MNGLTCAKLIPEKQRMNKPIIATLLLCGTIPTYASDWYVLGALSQSQVNLDTSALDKELSNNGAAALNSSDSGTNGQWRLQGGYKLTPNIALEAGYIDLGKSTYKATFSGGSAKADWSSGGIDVAALGILPLNDKFSMFGKVGAIATKTSTDWKSSGITGIPDGTKDKSQTLPFFGIGASYSLNDRNDVRVEYEQFNGAGDSSVTGKADVSVVSLGVTYRF